MSVDDEPSGVAARPDLVAWAVRSLAPVAGLIALLGIAIQRVSVDPANDDTFFHLRFGAEFLDGWSLWNPGSPTDFGTRAWVPTQWLSQILMALTEDVAGLSGLVWLAGLLFVVYACVLYLTSRAEAPPLVAAVVAVAAMIASAEGLSARPQIVSYILVAVVTSAWLRTLRDGRIRWWLILLTWVWAMLHGMWLAAVVVSLAGAAGVAVDCRGPARERLLPLIVPVGSLAAATVTPVGPALLGEVLVVGSRSTYFAEWGPPDFTDPLSMVLGALLALPALVWLRRGGTAWTHILLFLVAAGWAVYSLRTAPVAAAMAAPIAATALGSVVPAHPHGWDRRVLGGCAAAALVVMGPLAAGADPSSGPADAPRVARQLESLPAGTPLLNEWDWGGYLMWRHPGPSLVTSGYGDVFTSEELERNVDLVAVRAGWEDHLTDLGVEYAVLDADSDLAYALIEQADWTLMTEDGKVQLLHAPD